MFLHPRVPQDIHGPEDREMLARLAASTDDDQSADSEAAIEKYLRSVLAVENILTLDRLRQVNTVFSVHTLSLDCGTLQFYSSVSIFSVSPLVQHT